MAALRIALAKGRLLKEAAPLLERAALAMLSEAHDERKLILPCVAPGIEFVIVRAADVITYVEYGAADLGIVGKDMLMEAESTGIYELHDLGIAKCRLSVAGVSGQPTRRRPRVATKYCVSAQQYFSEQKRQVSIIKLYGSMEMAPVLGLSDLIVDLVASGKTLAANGLQELETIRAISARLIANRAAMKMKAHKIEPIVRKIADSCVANRQ